MNTNQWIWKTIYTLHNNTSAGTVLQAIKGERTAGLLSNNLSLFADVRWLPTTPGLVFSVRKTDQSTTQRLQRLLSFRTSPQKGLHNRTTSPTLSCSCFVRCRLLRPPRVSTDVTQRRRDDNLQVIWRASPRVLCSKLHYLRLCRPKITSI